jgi:hypothetical protein
MTEDELLELARECTRSLIESDIAAIKQGDSSSMSYFWDLCYEKVDVIKGDDALRDQLWAMVCTELEEVQINYLLKGETAKDGELRRVRLERERARLKLIAAEGQYAELDRRFRALEGS